MRKPICDLVSEETKCFCAENRAELSPAQRLLGWDYDWFFKDGCIYGAVFSPDGEIFDPIVLQDLTNME